MRQYIAVATSFLAVLVSVVTPLQAAQATRRRTFGDLRASVAQANAPSGVQVRLRWLTAEPVVNPAQTENLFEVLSIQPVGAAVRAERSPQVVSTSLVVISVDDMGRELDWRIVADPRVVRAEASSGSTLRDDRLYYVDIEFVLVIPDLSAIAQLHIYRASGRGVLDLLATTRLR